MHMVVLLRNMYANQKAAVKTEFGETEEFDIGIGMPQGCIMSPLFLNICAEKIMREVWTNVKEEFNRHRRKSINEFEILG